MLIFAGGSIRQGSDKFFVYQRRGFAENFKTAV